MINTLYLPELREMLAEEDVPGLQEFCTALHPARTAEFMEGLAAAEQWAVLRHAELVLREQIFAYFPHARQVEIIETQDRAGSGGADRRRGGRRPRGPAARRAAKKWSRNCCRSAAARDSSRNPAAAASIPKGPPAR